MDNSTERRSRQSAHLARQRKNFISAAQRALATSGTSATIDDFATEAGVTVATLYNHFPSKESLVQLALTQATDDWEESMTSAVAGLDNPAERLVASFRLFLRIPGNDPDFSKLASIAIAGGVPVILKTADHAIIEIDALNRIRNLTLTSREKRFQSFFAALLAELGQQAILPDAAAADSVVVLLLPLLGFSEAEANELVRKALPAS
jgi:AcrR family transcriptional regulator